MKYILMAFGLCFGASLYLSVGLGLIAILPFGLFEEIKASGSAEDVWMAMVMWPIYLLANALMWCLEKIDKILED